MRYNKKVYHDYFLEETFEAGIALAGTEVKSMRMGKCKHILQAVRRTRQGAGADDADDEDEEQGRHPHGADPLDAAAYAAHDHQHGDEHEGQRKGDGHVGLAQQPLKHVGAAHSVSAKFGADEVAKVHHHIAQTVAAQSAVKAEDQRRSGNTQPAQPLEALGDALVCKK